jgi:hypothetical protein
VFTLQNGQWNYQNAAVDLSGKITTKTSGTDLSPLTGTLTVGSVNSGLQYKPNGSVVVDSGSWYYYSWTNYYTLGEVKVTGNDGPAAHGNGYLSWGSQTSPWGTYGYTYLNGQTLTKEVTLASFGFWSNQQPVIQ